MGSRYQKIFETKKVCINVVYNFDHLSWYSGMTQFQEKWEKPIFLPVFAPANQWVQDTETFFLKKVFRVIFHNFNLLSRYSRMTQFREN